MYLPKTDIYNSLKKLNYYVSQIQPPVFNDLPAIIFRIDNNNVNIDLNNEITSQNIDIIIDIWFMDSVTGSKVLNEIENLMRNNLYRMTFSADVPNVDSLQHINCRFSKLI
ncbi:MAG: hypothetical protein RR557_05515 [Bacilli bacterium]